MPPQRQAARVRDLRIGDIAESARLIAEIPLWQRYGYEEARCASDLRAALKRHDLLKLAVANGAIAGLAWVLPSGGFGRFPYLKILAVREGVRGRGIGAALLEAAERGGDLFLLVSDFNRRAQRFYTGQGYRRVGALPGLVLPDVTEILLLKRVANPTVPSRRRRARRASAPPEAGRSRAR